MTKKQRVYNLVRRTEYRAINRTTIGVATFSSQAAANAATEYYVELVEQSLKRLFKEWTGETAKSQVEIEKDEKTGLIRGKVIMLALANPTAPVIVDSWEIVPTIVDEDVEAQNEARPADQLLNEFSEIFAWMKKTAQAGIEIKASLPASDAPDRYIDLALPKTPDVTSMDDYTLMTVKKTDKGYYLYLRVEDAGDDKLLRIAHNENDIVYSLQKYLNQEG